MPDFVVRLRDVDLAQIATVGGKNANLGALLRHLEQAGVRVPDGFAITAHAFREHLRVAGLASDIYRELARLDVEDTNALARAAKSIRDRVSAAPLPDAIGRAVTAAYEQLSQSYGEQATDVAVRSSATAEDVPEASFAGQHDTFVNVRGVPAVLDAVRACMASLFTDRAIVYRNAHGIPHDTVALAVCVQKMVRSDLASAGVMFTLDTESGFTQVVEITASWGLGESLVRGRIDPDTFTIHKPTLARGFRSIIEREIGGKATKLIYGDDGGLVEVAVPVLERRRPSLSDNEVLKLARWAVAIEDYHSRRIGRPCPMDIEWAKDGRTGDLFIVQARPETVHAGRAKPLFELYRLTGEGSTVTTGKAVGEKIAQGTARVLRSTNELAAFQPGDVLVTELTDPGWEPVLARASAIVTDHGGRTCHAAIVARELGVPCVVGTGNATQVIQTGTDLTVTCAEGDVGRVLAGRVPFVREVIEADKLPHPPVPVMLDIGDPANAFKLAQLPSAGVGIARIEFLVAAIGIHPMALVYPERVSDPHQRAELDERIAGHASPGEVFIERVATGVARIAAGFYPRPVIVRFSDFESHGYAGLLGGKDFEPGYEANPLLGFRGAARYCDDRYREGFALECAAIRRVRRTMGLTNVKVMIPFCRTLDEAQRVLDVMAAADLRRGDEGLEVYMTCEIPNNAVLASRFAELFDGFSIDSDDLAQLVLGIDRDSALLAHAFDESDPGVRAMIARMIQIAHRKGRPVGLSGHAPSGDPSYVRFLASLDIDSISVPPGALPRVVMNLARLTPPKPVFRDVLDRAMRAFRNARPARERAA
ncbi:MAG TPA: phosphoenolpyruvate synthase [Kofleriaceae bacterium]|nr:phosphoenolpyruvate synthase [Kofleriaceae bacterium]